MSEASVSQHVSPHASLLQTSFGNVPLAYPILA